MNSSLSAIQFQAILIAATDKLFLWTKFTLPTKFHTGKTILEHLYM